LSYPGSKTKQTISYINFFVKVYSLLSSKRRWISCFLYLTAWGANGRSASREIPSLTPEFSSLCSQEPATCLYPEPDESSPYPSTCSLRDN